MSISLAVALGSYVCSVGSEPSRVQWRRPNRIDGYPLLLVKHGLTELRKVLSPRCAGVTASPMLLRSRTSLCSTGMDLMVIAQRSQ